MTEFIQADQRVGAKTAAMLTGKCARTIRRWAAIGEIQSVMVGNGRQGAANTKHLFDLSSLAPHIPVKMTKKFIQSVMKAEAGDTKCLVDVAAHFLSCKQPSVAILWFEEAAAKGDASAMNTLSECYLKGLGTERNDALGLKWLGEAAIHGNAIAQAKIETLSLLLSDNGVDF
jgi:TPR repeat protein